MNKQQLLNTIENVKLDFRQWNDLKVREVQQGIITHEQYEEALSVSKERIERQVAGIENELANLRG